MTISFKEFHTIIFFDKFTFSVIPIKSFDSSCNPDNTFKISLQHPADFPLPLMEGITVKAGFKTSIVISPQVLDSTRRIKALDRNIFQLKHENLKSMINHFELQYHWL
jgi:hypothetical protein